MGKNKVEIEEAENGLTVRVWNNDEKTDGFGYAEPENYVAKTLDEALAIVKDEMTVNKDLKGDA